MRRIGFHQLGGGADILLGRQSTEDRGFLRQIADPKARSAVHGKPRDVVPVERDGTVIGRNETGDQVEDRRLARAVGPQKPDHFAALQGQADAAHDRALLEALADTRDRQPLEPFDESGGWSLRTVAQVEDFGIVAHWPGFCFRGFKIG